MRRRERWTRPTWAGCALALFFAGTAAADVAVIQAARDNTLIEDPAGALSNGSGPALFAGRTSQLRNSIRRAVVVFDVASVVPAGSMISGVRLTLHMSQTNAGPVPVDLHLLDAAWGEGTSLAAGGSGAPATAGDATWLHAFHDDRFWRSPGGDFAAVPLASTVVDQPGAYAWGAGPELVDAVQAWLDAPAGNHGWLLRADEAASSTVKRFDSREHPDPALHPTLTIEYVPPCDPGPLAGPGYWHRQCAGDPIEPGFAESVAPCADAALAELGFAGMPACGLVTPDRPAACRERALRDLTSLLFNLCARRVQTSCPAPAAGPDDPPTLGALAARIAALLLAGECPSGAWPASGAGSGAGRD